MATKKITKLAKTVNAQVNPNVTQRNAWKNCDKALTENTKTYATSYANRKKTKNGYVDNHPWVLTAHNFDLDLPSNAYVKSIEFIVCIRTNKNNFKAWKPPEARFNIYGSAYTKKYDEKRVVNSTGWEKGIYYVNGGKGNLSSTWDTISYTMNEANIKKGKFKASDFNAEVMGVDLRFFNAGFFANADEKKEASVDVHIAWVKVKVIYEVPTYKISYKDVSTLGRRKCFKATFTQSSKANGGTQVMDVEIPWGTELVSPTSTTNGFNPSTMKWTVNAKAGAKTSVDFCVDTFLEGNQTINIGNATTKKFPYVYETPINLDDGYDDISLSIESEAHKNHRDCLIVAVEGVSSDDTVTFDASFNKAVTPIGWTLDSASSGVDVDESDTTSVILTVPSNERFTAYLRYCFIPTATGSYTANVYCDDMMRSKSLSFTVANPYVYHLGQGYSTGENNANITTDYIKTNTHRVASEIGTNATVIPVRSDENDAIMHISPCTLHMKKWAELDYIGCVPLEHLHFDPKSTYKDKLLDSHYKNKRYMGKQLASDEDITLNVRLHPPQVTTIQSLIDMDKPIPINANHKCFEGDALNHRGWAEIYGITVTRTNPHWYKCDIDVKYLTHNLNTRFKIDKGNKIYNQPISSIMSEVFERGDKLAEDITQDFFSVVTDGTYMYNTSEVVEVDYLTNEGYEVVKNGTNAQYTDSAGVTHTIDTLANFVAYLEDNNYDVIVPTTNLDTVKVKALLDVPTNQRNMFSIDNGQYIDIQTRNTLGVASEVSFEWANVVSDELRENNLERIIELVDKDTNKAVFKYQYSDFKYDYDDTTEPSTIESVRATPIAYVRKNGDWITQSEEIELDTIVGTGGIIDDSDTATPIDTSIDDDYQDDNSDTSELIIGSTVHFILDNHTLQVIDEGFNSREFETSKMELEGESYYWRTRWVNKNSDGESNDMVCFFDFSVSDTIIDTQYADKYSKLIVSPFPVSDKKLVFSREAEEGTVYYYEDDNEEFSYLIEPYYQYMNGTDLVTDSGISIFNLNYGYKLVYIQNGLVRLGFDRIDGRLYLGKYDVKSDTYVTTTHMHLDKYSDINVKSITDDKIEIQASDSIFTIWRGHPYIMINHPTEEIIIDTQFNKVWAEKVGGDDASELPIYWDLMNNANILPSCVGGQKEIRSSCVEVDASDLTRTATTLSYASGTDWSDIEVGTDKTITLTSDNLSMSDTIDIGSGHCAFGDYTVEIGHDYTVPTEIILNGDSIIQNGEKGELNAKVVGYDYIPIEGKSVDFIQKNKQLYFDKGTSTDYNNTNWTQWTTYPSTVTRGTDETTITKQSSSTLGYHIYVNWNSQKFTNEIVEFDVYVDSSVNNNIFLQLRNPSRSVLRQLSLSNFNLTANNWYHFKIDFGTGVISNTTNTSTQTFTVGENYTAIYLAVQVAQNSTKYKNFKIIGDEKVYPITDTLFSDKGITGDTNSNWYNNSYGTVSVGSDGTLLTSNNTTNFLMYSASNSSHTSNDQYIWNVPFMVEFDVVSLTGSTSEVQFQVYSNESTNNWATGLTGTGHYKAIVLDGSQRLYKDGILQGNVQAYSLPNCRITLRVKNSATLKYKNFKIYRIVEFSTTNSNGIATCQLVGDGSGEETYYAKANNLVSNDYELIDCYRYDKATTVDHNDIWAVNNGTLTRSEEYSTIEETSVGTTCFITIINIPFTDYRIEYDVFQVDGTKNEWSLTVLKNNYDAITSTNSTLNDWKHISVDITNQEVNTRVRINTGGTCTKARIKNFKLYPIPSEEEPTPVTPVATTLTLTSNKDVLSAYDSETATLTATVLDQNGNAMSGESVVFKKGSSTLDTVQTNSNGVATYTYTATGVGDVTITVTCESLTQTQTIEDCLSAKLTETTITNSSGTKISSVGLDAVYNIQNTDFSLEFDSQGNGVLNIGAKDYWSSSSANYRATIGYADGKNYWSVRTTSTTEGYGSNASTSTEYRYKITREGTTVKFYVDDSLIQTRTFSSFGSYSSWSIYSIIWGSGTQKVKNIKLKPL